MSHREIQNSPDEPESLREGDGCADCGHPFDPHAVVTTGENPLEGGIILCPECDCYGTWSTPLTQGPIVEPTPEELRDIREQVFG
jgi:hypothetical protein